MWVAKGDLDKHGGHDAFIRDTRRKTSIVFDRISDNFVDRWTLTSRAAGRDESFGLELSRTGVGLDSRRTPRPD